MSQISHKKMKHFPFRSRYPYKAPARQLQFPSTREQSISYVKYAKYSLKALFSMQFALVTFVCIGAQSPRFELCGVRVLRHISNSYDPLSSSQPPSSAYFSSKMNENCPWRSNSSSTGRSESVAKAMKIKLKNLSSHNEFMNTEKEAYTGDERTETQQDKTTRSNRAKNRKLPNCLALLRITLR